MSVKNLKANIDVDTGFDFLIGADGSYSVVRRQLMRAVRFVKCSSFQSPLSKNFKNREGLLPILFLFGYRY
jgi:2-polyprenyl-6-methoxyphenol hydroxylase-like FAD-dependent oxidoreductase